MYKLIIVSLQILIFSQNFSQSLPFTINNLQLWKKSELQVQNTFVRYKIHNYEFV